MAWPSNLNHVSCIGFPKRYLPIVKRAMDEEMVVWGVCDLFMDMGRGRFTWAGIEWEITEMTETIVSIKLVKGELTGEDLTAAVLRG